MRLKKLLAINLAVSLFLNLELVMAASPVIGTALASGAFRLDGSTVMGNGTVFEGSTVETAHTGSSIQLSSGARLVLGAASRGKLYGDRIMLEKGSSRLENGTGFRLVALGLTIEPRGASSTGVVAVGGSEQVRVEALTGGFRVLNARGLPVGNLAPGMTLAFEPEGSAGAGTRITGVLEKKDGRFVITDEVTKVVVEITGSGLDAQLGARIEVIGSLDPAAAPVAGATQVIRAAQIRRLPKTPSSGGAAPASGRISAAKVSTGVVAIIGGVAVAAVLGGLAAADDLPGKDDTPVSR